MSSTFSVWTERIGGAQWRVLVDLPGKPLFVYGPYTRVNADIMAARLQHQYALELAAPSERGSKPT